MKADATIVLTPVENPFAYGLVETESDGRVSRFLEKPKPEELNGLTTNNINAGIYILVSYTHLLIPAAHNLRRLSSTNESQSDDCSDARLKSFRLLAG